MTSLKNAAYVVTLRYRKEMGGDFVSSNPFVGLFGWASLVRMCKTLGLILHVKRCKATTLDEILRECENFSYIDDLRHHGTTRLEDSEPVLYDLSSLIDRLLGKEKQCLNVKVRGAVQKAIIKEKGNTNYHHTQGGGDQERRRREGQSEDFSIPYSFKSVSHSLLEFLLM